VSDADADLAADVDAELVDAALAPQEPRRSVARAATGMGAAAAASRAIGGGRVLVVAAVLGTTFLGNTFEAANTLPTVVFELLAAGALSAVLVPPFVERLEASDQSGAERAAGGLLGLFLVGLGVLTVLGLVFAPQLASLLTANVDDPSVAAAQDALGTDLLRWFLPQLLLYPIGFLAIALLHAHRTFALPSAAPIANTVVLVASMVLFAVVAGPNPGLDLSPGEVAILGLGGTLGVAAFVAVPAVALHRKGFSLRPRWAPKDAEVRSLLGRSGWAALQHGGAALLLGAAMVMGAASEGGVIAYRFAWFLFLAPYGIIAQPIHTAVLPELAGDARDDDRPAFGLGVRWSLGALAVTVVPVAAAMVALSVPIATVLAFGEADTAAGISLIAASLASLAVGLPAYGAFRLLSAAWFARGDSRTPAVVGVASALLGVAVMVVGGSGRDGAGLMWALGLGHSVAFIVGSLALVLPLQRWVRVPVLAWRPVVAAGVGVLVAVGGWFALDAWSPSGKPATVLALAAVGLVGGGAYVAAVRGLHLTPGPSPAAGAVPA
jgi:putative peptidoglycan lipid II flippase